MKQTQGETDHTGNCRERQRLGQGKPEGWGQSLWSRLHEGKQLCSRKTLQKAKDTEVFKLAGGGAGDEVLSGESEI